MTLPDWNINMTGVVSVLERDRPGATNGSSGSSAPGTTGSLNLGVVAGVPCVRLVNGVNLNGGPVLVFDQGGRIHVNTLATNIQFSEATADFRCNRIYALVRVAATPTDATDCGLELILGGNASLGVLNPGVPGWLINFDTTGGCSLVQHGNSTAQTSVVLKSAAAGFVNTDWNQFEFRLLGAQRNSPGVFKVLLNNQLAVTRSFANAPDDLPIPSSPGANVNNGYVVNIQNMGRNSELDVALVRVQAGPTEASLF
jgi:hypothetical protein